MTTTKWALDPTHSEIGFKVKHMQKLNLLPTPHQLTPTTNKEMVT
jgi:hypothetical protein